MKFPTMNPNKVLVMAVWKKFQYTYGVDLLFRGMEHGKGNSGASLPMNGAEIYMARLAFTRRQLLSVNTQPKNFTSIHMAGQTRTAAMGS